MLNLLFWEWEDKYVYSVSFPFKILATNIVITGGEAKQQVLHKSLWQCTLLHVLSWCPAYQMCVCLRSAAVCKRTVGLNSQWQHLVPYRNRIWRLTIWLSMWFRSGTRCSLWVPSNSRYSMILCVYESWIPALFVPPLQKVLKMQEENWCEETLPLRENLCLVFSKVRLFI